MPAGDDADRCGPEPCSLDSRRAARSDAATRAAFVDDLVRTAGKAATVPPETWRLPLAEALARAGQALRDQGVALDLPPGELLARFHAYAANTDALQRYRPGPLHAPVTLVKAAASPVDPAAWEPLLDGELRVTTVPGDHYSLLRPPTVAQVARALDHRLETGGGQGGWPRSRLL